MAHGKRRGEALWQEQWEWQMKILDYLNTGELSGIDLAELGFEGTITPEAGALLGQAFGEAAHLTDDPLEAERQAALSTMMSGAGAYQMNMQEFEDLYRTTIEIPMMRKYEEEIAPAIAHQYITRGQTGPGIEQGYIAGRQVMEGLMGERSKLLAGEREREWLSKENAMARIGQGVGLSQMELQAGLPAWEALMEAGGAERGIRGQFNNERLQRLIAAQPWNDPRLGMSALGYQMPGQMQAGGTSGIGGIMQGVGGLLSLGAPFAGTFGQHTPSSLGFF